METRANYAIIGLFTIAVIAAAFGFVYWFAGTESGTKKAAYKIEFTGSVAGLNKGAPVLFNGIRVGDVTDVYFDKSKPNQAFAKIEVQPDLPVKADTKAALDVAILSGAAVVALTGGDPNAPALAKAPDQDLPTIVAERGGLSSLLETARGTADKANRILELALGIVNDSRGSITTTIRNLETFSTALASNSASIDSFLQSVGTAAKSIGPLASKLETLTDGATSLISSVEPDRIRSIVRNVEGVTQTFEGNRDKVASILANVAGLSGRLNDAAPKLDQALADLTRTLAAIDPVKLNQAIDNTQRFTSGLASSTPDTQAALRNANELTAKLNASASRIDGVLKAAENFLGSAAGQEGKSTFQAIRTAMEAFERASDNLNRRATQIGESVSRVAGAGSRQVEALGTDARRAVNTIGRAASGLERNPSSVIFGSGRPSIPEYGGR